jgi:hypothetical protein
MMYEHALGVLDSAAFCEWPITNRTLSAGNTDTKFRAVIAPLLRSLIIESRHLGGSLLDQFWFHLGNCHPQLEQNSEQEESRPDLGDL